MAILTEFRQFIIRGNVLELAVGVIIGGAFNKIVSSLIEDIITPLILNPLLQAARVNTLAEYVWHGAKPGMFISAIITFLLTGFVLFLIIRAINRVRVKDEKKPEVVAAMNTSEKLLSEIRDAVKELKVSA